MSTSQLLAPYTHVASLKTKGLRDLFIDAVNDIVGADADHVALVKEMVSKLHNASLLLDDIEDSAPKRRGQPAAHTIFGVPLTMNAANMVIFEVLGECLRLDAARRDAGLACPSSKNAVEIFHEELSLLHHGQGQDIFWRDTNQCPTEDEYRKMVINKTGGLFRLAARWVWLGAKPDEDRAALHERLVATTDHISFLFQVLDDYLNLCSEEYHEKKTFCEDLSEGKFSFLTTHSIRTAGVSGDLRLQRLLQGRPTEIDKKKFCLELMRGTDTFRYTHETMLRLAHECWALCGQLVSPPTSPAPQNGVAKGAADDEEGPNSEPATRADGDASTPPAQASGENSKPRRSSSTKRLFYFVEKLRSAIPQLPPTMLCSPR